MKLLEGLFSSPAARDRQMMHAACGSDMGLKRANNEDNFFLDGRFKSAEDPGSGGILDAQYSLQTDHFLAVFDGMGGGDYGELAAYRAASAAGEFLRVKENVNPYDITPSLQALCDYMNRSVYAQSQDLGAWQMGTTVVSLYFHENQVWAMNVGDSRSFLLRDGHLHQLSVDHVEQQTISGDSARKHKPYLLQYLGVNPEETRIEPSIKSLVYQPFDRFLVSSDGLTDMVSEEAIQDLLLKIPNPQDCVQALIQAALKNGGKDNVTVMICDIR